MDQQQNVTAFKLHRPLIIGPCVSWDRQASTPLGVRARRYTSGPNPPAGLPYSGLRDKMQEHDGHKERSCRLQLKMHRSTAGSDHQSGMSRVISRHRRGKSKGHERTHHAETVSWVRTHQISARRAPKRSYSVSQRNPRHDGSGKTPCAAATSHVTPIRNQDTPKTGAAGKALYGDVRVFAMVVSGWKPTKCGGGTLNSCGQCMTCGSCISLCWGPRRHTRSGSSSVGEGREK